MTRQFTSNVASNVLVEDIVGSRELQERGYTIQPLLDADDIRSLSMLHHEITPTVPVDYYVSAFDNDLATRRRICEGIAAVVQDKLKKLAPGYRILLATFVTKRANSFQGRTGLHRDISFVDHVSGSGLNVWCPLSDVDNHNSCLRVVEGSHVFGQISPAPYDGGQFRNVIEELYSHYLTEVPMPAGSAMLFDPSLLHASEDNRSDSDRTAIILVLVRENVKPRYHQWNKQQRPDKLEVYEIDREFVLRFTPIRYLDNVEQLGAKFIGLIDYKYEVLTSTDLRRMLPGPHPPLVQDASYQPGRRLKRIVRRGLLVLYQSARQARTKILSFSRTR